ncbi:MAG: elongation factor G [Thermodesulfobacteriota bacterium]
MQDTKLLRNVALLGQSGTGKTSLAEALLFTAGKLSRLGRVDDGSSAMDSEPEETRRHITISAAFHNCDWKRHTIVLTDTPGEDNFFTEAAIAIHMADAAILVLDAPSGVKYQTEKLAAAMRRQALPAMVVVNKMDKERANFPGVTEALKAVPGLKPAVIQLPIGAEAAFSGVVDLVAAKAYVFDKGGTGKVQPAPIPEDMADEVRAAREVLMEAVAETDDELIEKFLEEGELNDEDLAKGLTAGVRRGQITPVLVAAATANLGSELILSAVLDLLPPPDERSARAGTDPKTGSAVERLPAADAPFSAVVMKTMSDPYAGKLSIFRVLSGTITSDSTVTNTSKGASERLGQLLVLEGKSQRPVAEAGPGMVVAVTKLKETATGDTLAADATPVLYPPLTPAPAVMSFAVSPAKKGDEEKVFSAIGKVLEEDITLRLSREVQTKEILISGVGQLHLEVVVEKIRRKYGVEMALHPPKVPYKETIKGSTRIQGRYKKQSGGRGQYGDTWLEIEPLPRGGGFQFEDKIVGGVVPRQYIPAVEKGIVEAMSEGALAGYPIVDVKVALVDGSYHTVDSSEMAFKIAASMGFKKGILQSSPVLLEPIMNMTITVPKDCVGDVIGDLNSRRGKVMGMDSGPDGELVTAQVPMAEVLTYSPDLTSITGGRGSFVLDFSHYEEVPSHLTEKIVAAASEAKGS